MLPHKISAFSEIISDFDLFVFDLCGVIHNGIKLQKATIDFVKSLRKSNKKIVFLSNSPNANARASNHLKEYGFEVESHEPIYTSGDYFIKVMQQNPEYQNKSFYFFGKKYNLEFLLENNLKIVQAIEEADFIIGSPFSADQIEVEHIEAHVRSLSKHGLVYLCANPDIYAPHGEEMRYTPGYFAKKYHESGGEVRYFGKPEKAIYEFALDNILLEKKINKSKTIMIGDSMHTDIKGAKNYGINSLLVGGGYHRKINFYDNQALSNLFQEYGFVPEYYIATPKN